MIRMVTALYDTLPQAELALAHLNSEVGVEAGDIVDRSIAGRTRLARMKLSEEERARCVRELEEGGFLLVAQVKREHDPDRIVALLQEIPIDGLGKSDAPAPGAPGEFEGFRVEDPKAAKAPAQAAPEAPAAPAPTAAEKPGGSTVGYFEGFRVEDPKAAAPQEPASAASNEAAEEHIPILEEELRIGKREVLRGGARVHTHVAEHPVRQEIELLVEHTSIERRPAVRKVSEEEIEEGGLMRERVIEVSEMREEAVVSKETVVREEVIVRKTVERRTEVIDETVRRTEVEAERLPGAESRPALSGLASSDKPETARS